MRRYMKIGMVFPAQGAQFVGMGKELYDSSRIMQEYFEQASNCLDTNFVKLCFASSDAELKTLPYAYTSLFLVSTAIWALLQEQGIQPQVVAGYNIGECGALHATQSLSLPDGLYLLNKYAFFYQDLLNTIDVVALRIQDISSRDIEQVCKRASSAHEHASIAVYESGVSNIVAGHAGAVVRVEEMLLQEHRGAKLKKLSATVGLHSLLMKPVVDQLSVYFEKIDFKDATLPIISSVDAHYIMKSEEIKKNFITQLQQPILWAQSIELMSDCDIIIEVGPGKQTSTILSQRYPALQTVAINTKADLEQLRMIIGE